jgi:hypothetical protein
VVRDHALRIRAHVRILRVLQSDLPQLDFSFADDRGL